MKKLLLIAVVAMMAMPAMAQESGDMRANAGLGYLLSPFGGDGQIGFGAGFEYVFSDGMSGQVGFGSYDGATLINLDYRYYFMTDDTQVYGSVGFTSFSPDGGDAGNGLSLGAGAIFAVSDNIGINAGLKYELVQAEVLEATATGFTIEEKALGLNAQVGVVYMF